MNVEKPKSEERASIDFGLKWRKINWTVVETRVNRLQSRIAKAAREGRFNQVKILQYLLVKSYYAKLMAVKKVMGNKGCKTAGVDGELWSSDSKKYQGAIHLKNGGYKASPLRRTYIKKANGKLRPLGIPTMRDRSMQALHALSLDPVAESILSTKAFGFRKHRSCHDAQEYIFKCLGTKVSGKWVLEGDIKGCFDHISHQWIMENVPMNKRILKQFLTAGFVYKKDLYPTEEGTPQGGIISPILANLTLNGLAEMLAKKYSMNANGNISRNVDIHKIHTIIYADDFIITANNEEILHQVKEDIEEFLQERGLELSESKTLITHINEGFDFLGWSFRKFKTKLIIAPSKKSVKNICKKIDETVRKNLMQKQEILIKQLNALIRGWCNYHKSSCAKKAFQTIDKYVFYALWNWAKRRHSTKSKHWRKKRYFHQEGSRDWIYGTEKVKLVFASDTKIKRHRLIKFEANPYLREYDEYYSKRRGAC
mgnify:CR=1 FL=1